MSDGSLSTLIKILLGLTGTGGGAFLIWLGKTLVTWLITRKPKVEREAESESRTLATTKVGADLAEQLIQIAEQSVANMRRELAEARSELAEIKSAFGEMTERETVLKARILVLESTLRANHIEIPA